MIEDLTNEHNETVKKVTYNKEQIDILFARLGDIVNDFKAGDKTLQEQVDELRKYIDDILEYNNFWLNTYKAFLEATIKKRVVLRLEVTPKRPIEINLLK